MVKNLKGESLLGPIFENGIPYGSILLEDISGQCLGNLTAIIHEWAK
jgi:hypothetical protein